MINSTVNPAPYKKATISLYSPKMLMHNGQLANPLNPITKMMKAATGTRNKTDADYEQLGNLEYQGSLYLNKDMMPVIPAHMLGAFVHAGAKKFKQGKDALAGILVEDDAVISYAGGPMTIEELIDSPDHRLTVGVKVGQSKVMRTRPLFKDVAFTFTVEFDPELINGEDIRKWVSAACLRVGLGDWRPRYGRGHITSFEIMEEPVVKAA